MQGSKFLPLPLTIITYRGDYLYPDKYVSTPAFSGHWKMYPLTGSWNGIQLGSRSQDSQFNKRKLMTRANYPHPFMEGFYRRCRYAYSIKTNPRAVQCDDIVMLSETISEKVNTTPVYTEDTNTVHGWSLFGCQDETDCAGAITKKAISVRYNGERWVEICLFLLLGAEDKRHPIYCMNTNERESFQLEFWISPFDYYTWAAIFLVSATVHFILGILCKILSFRWTWRNLHVVVALNLLVSVSVMMLCWFYECVMSSKLTVLPPVIKLESLEDLVSQNYKIMVLSVNHSKPYYSMFYESDLMDMYNSSFTYTGTLYLTEDELMLYVIQCNSTYFSSVDSGQDFINRVTKRKSNIYCYLLNQVSLLFPDFYSVSGPGKFRITQITSFLFEAGMLAHFREIEAYNSMLPLSWGKAQDENEAKPFKITDWKISSVFYGITLFLLGSSTCFVGELFRRCKCKKTRK